MYARHTAKSAVFQVDPIQECVLSGNGKCRWLLLVPDVKLLGAGLTALLFAAVAAAAVDDLAVTVSSGHFVRTCEQCAFFSHPPFDEAL